MHTLNIPQLKQFVQHVAVDLNEPLMVWGGFGSGKSAAIAQFCDEHNTMLVDIRLSQYDSVDLRGNPVPDHERQRTVWYAPETLPFVGNDAFPDDRLIVLFLDEINGAQPATAAVAYQLVLDRRIGEHVLKPNVRIIAAGNRESDRGVTNRMPMPLANRFIHVEAVAEVDAVCQHFQSIGLPSIGVAFLQFRKNLLSTFDPAKPDKAVASARTWEKALRAYAVPTMPLAIKQAAMAGAVGEGPAAEFWGFESTWKDIIPVAQIIADPTGTPLPDQAGMMYAVAVNISGSMNTRNVKPLHTYLMRMEPEFAILAWQLAVKRDEDLFTADEYLDFSVKYRAVFKA